MDASPTVGGLGLHTYSGVASFFAESPRRPRFIAVNVTLRNLPMPSVLASGTSYVKFLDASVYACPVCRFVPPVVIHTHVSKHSFAPVAGCAAL